MTGVIVRLVKDKGFGFIRDEKGTEYFFHRSGIKNAKFEDLLQQQEVTFEEVEGTKGPRAEDVFI